MQKSRRRRGLELDLLSLSALAALVACAGPVPPASTPQKSQTEPDAPNAPTSAPNTSSVGTPPPPLPSDSETKPSLAPPATTSASPEPGASAAQELPKGTLVLHIGDSFADALGGALGKLLKANGVRNDLEFKTPSYIPNWSYGGEIQQFVTHYHPDLVIITLGANEIEIPHPEERAKPVQHLVSLLGGRPCVWVAPPLWKPDSGVLKVIRDNIAPCRYLDSNLLVHDLPRARDKIHPSPEGREIWAKLVFDWLIKERVGSPTQPWALRPEPAPAAPNK